MAPQARACHAASHAGPPDISTQIVLVTGYSPVHDGAGSVQESEEELNARLRELKGMDKERQKTRKLTKAEQEEENLFKKNKGSLTPPPPSSALGRSTWPLGHSLSKGNTHQALQPRAAACIAKCMTASIQRHWHAAGMVRARSRRPQHTACAAHGLGGRTMLSGR